MTQDELRDKFIYEPQTGMLRKVKNALKPYPWRAIGNNKQYLAHSYNAKGQSIYLHQAVWLYHHGYIPKVIDHINGNAMDNRIENLRPCTLSQNQFNSKKKVSNKSGFKGVVFHPKCKNKPWQAKINLLGKRISLGYYATKEEAAIAYNEGAKRFAGEFANLNDI